MPDLSASLPSSLVRVSRFVRLGPSDTPALLAHPEPESGRLVPLVLWMHGRTVTKELDPGRYLRWVRAGIGACAVDLPGHGERYDATMHEPSHTLDVVLGMIEEIDGIVEAALDTGAYDPQRVAIGGMSAGGMATLARLVRPHRFRCASVEATTGSWGHQVERAMFRSVDRARWADVDPMTRIDAWRPIPFQAFHSKLDEWVSFKGQSAFVEAVRARTPAPMDVDFVAYDRTGAPAEHAGFGVHAADAKNRQRDFLVEHLLGDD